MFPHVLDYTACGTLCAVESRGGQTTKGFKPSRILNLTPFLPQKCAGLGPVTFLSHYKPLADSKMCWHGRASVMFPISTAFIVAMVVMDQAVCWLLCYETPKGKSITFEARTMATHVVYGFLNCKTYSVILLLLLSAQGYQINLTIWALE